MGHLGLTPQSVHAFGGFKVQGKTLDAARVIVDDAVALAEAGCFAIVLECVPDAVARMVTDSVPVPDDRHRRRSALRRPGARVPRHPRLRGPRAAEVRAPLRRPRRATPRARHRAVRRRRARRALPGERRDVPRGRRGHRGARPLRIRSSTCPPERASPRSAGVTSPPDAGAPARARDRAAGRRSRSRVAVVRRRRCSTRSATRAPTPAASPRVGDRQPPGAGPARRSRASASCTSRSATGACASWSPTRSTSASQGLRGRSDLGPYDGMLFVFDGPTDAAFTMSGVPVPLDIGFYDADGAPGLGQRMEPCPERRRRSARCTAPTARSSTRSRR